MSSPSIIIKTHEINTTDISEIVSRHKCNEHIMVGARSSYRLVQNNAYSNKRRLFTTDVCLCYEQNFNLGR